MVKPRTPFASIRRSSTTRKAIDRYGTGEQGTEGTVKHPIFRLGDQTLRCIDSSVKQPFTFTPAISLVVECETEAGLDKLFARSSGGGKIFMPSLHIPSAADSAGSPIATASPGS